MYALFRRTLLNITTKTTLTDRPIFQIITMTEKADSYAGFNEYNPLLDTDVSER